MTVRNYRINIGQHYNNVVESAGSPITGNVEINVDEAFTINREQFLLALQELNIYIVRALFPA